MRTQLAPPWQTLLRQPLHRWWSRSVNSLISGLESIECVPAPTDRLRCDLLRRVKCVSIRHKSIVIAQVPSVNDDRSIGQTIPETGNYRVHRKVQFVTGPVGRLVCVCVSVFRARVVCHMLSQIPKLLRKRSSGVARFLLCSTCSITTSIACGQAWRVCGLATRPNTRQHCRCT